MVFCHEFLVGPEQKEDLGEGKKANHAGDDGNTL